MNADPVSSAAAAVPDRRARSWWSRARDLWLNSRYLSGGHQALSAPARFALT